MNVPFLAEIISQVPFSSVMSPFGMVRPTRSGSTCRAVAAVTV